MLVEIKKAFESHTFKLWWRWSLLLTVLNGLVFLLTGYTNWVGVASLWDLLTFPIFFGLVFLFTDTPIEGLSIVWLGLSVFIGIKFGTLFLLLSIIFVLIFVVACIALVFAFDWLFKKGRVFFLKFDLKMPEFLKKTINFMMVK